MVNRHTRSRERIGQDLSHARLLVGQRLRELSHDQYYFNDEKSVDDIGSLEWRCDDLAHVTMYLLSDGESVGADLSALEIAEAFELDDASSCSWRRENLFASLSVPSLVGKVITEVHGVIDVARDQTASLVGFNITFETGDYLTYLNQGDDAAVLINEPPKCLVGMETRWVTSFDARQHD
ncbi:hypothetical protein ACI77J_21320 [Pseudomonas sp. O64]|uniref:hypothetical protein n=1 Tax=Pseudomonas TaxID=286 RepID=UPI000BA04C4C|nr:MULTISPECIES: hypothetical protein [unclassified Pseudomonas]MCV2226269.1 hypothetical protein [Pseudomonas sp. AU10]OZO02717.1 hypothetical protein B7453_20150 [Pseudomonas sp. IB20]UNM18121.1 hypothetical protein K0P33_21570 [Pseudomonas sp. ArH3a]